MQWRTRVHLDHNQQRHVANAAPEKKDLTAKARCILFRCQRKPTMKNVLIIQSSERKVKGRCRRQQYTTSKWPTIDHTSVNKPFPADLWPNIGISNSVIIALMCNQKSSESKAKSRFYLRRWPPQTYRIKMSLSNMYWESNHGAKAKATWLPWELSPSD